MIRITLKKHMPVWDMTTNPRGDGSIPAGVHEFERIDSPTGSGHSWLVLKGTLLGMAETDWQSFTPAYWGERQITIEEN